MSFPFRDIKIRCEFNENFDTAQRLSHKKTFHNHPNHLIHIIHSSIIKVIYFSITIYIQADDFLKRDIDF